MGFLFDEVNVAKKRVRSIDYRANYRIDSVINNTPYSSTVKRVIRCSSE